MQKKILAAMIVAGFFGLAGTVSATTTAAYSVQDGIDQLAETLVNIGLIFAAVISVVLSTWVGLAGIKYGLKKFGKYFGFGGKF